MIIIDRFEEKYAVIEKDGEIIKIKKKHLPKEAKPGDVLIFDGKKYIIEDKKTEEIRKSNISLLEKLKNKNK